MDKQGIQTLTENGLETFSLGKNINEKVFYSAAEDAANQMWFVPMKMASTCKKNDTVIHLSSLNGLSSNDVSSIKKYGQHYMLAATSKGLDLITSILF